MKNNEIAQLMVDLHKTSFENSFKMLVYSQDQIEKMTKNVIEKLPWYPVEVKKTMDDLISNFKKGREDFKKMVDDGYEKLKKHYSGVKTNEPIS
ncbi:MAG: hypothetical protein APR62_05580 [Smithella sp. SDB]|nr:MAG: hypothetical protein APR62_05580 [Smithella sp. SDB]